MRKAWLVCASCGQKDESHAGHVGTVVTMRCPDCAGYDGRALLCRDCCDTGHRTRLDDLAGWARVDARAGMEAGQ